MHISTTTVFVLKEDIELDSASITPEKVFKAMQDAGKPVRPGDVAKALGVESKVLSNALDVLKKEGKIHSPKRCYYALVE